MKDTGIEKKKKGKPAMGRWRLFRWIGGFIVFAVVVIVILAILGPYVNGGQIAQTSLHSQYVPTAQSLLTNPLSTPQGFPISLTVEQDTVGFSDDSTHIEKFCIGGVLPEDVDIEIEFNRVAVFGHFAASGGGMNSDGIGIVSHCIWGQVETGLHLLSVEISSDTWTEQTYNYTWAIEITNDGYRYMPSYPFHNESD